MDNNDWGRLQESFDKINKQLEKIRRVSEKIPKLYIRTLVVPKDFMAVSFRDKDVKKMIPKLKNNNKQYEDLINKSLMILSMLIHRSHGKLFNKKFKWLVAVRGRKKTERFEQVDHILPTNQNWLKTPAQELQILFSVVSAQFDVNSSLIGGHMPINVWKKCVHNMLVILDILVQYPNINVDDSEEPYESETKKGADYNFFKSLQCIDPHTCEYIERLQDEPMFGDFEGSLKVALMRVELIYYKPQEVYDAMTTLVEPEPLNIFLLESVYLISVMLLEVFNIAANVHDVKRKIISKNFSRLLEISDKKHSTVLPKMLRIMSWLSQCFLSMETSTRLDKTKEEALIRTYLITFSSSYESECGSVMNYEHHARWDQPSGCIVFRNVEPSMVQALAFELTEKLSILAKSSERATEAWLGSVGWIALPLLQMVGVKTCRGSLLLILIINILFLSLFFSNLLCTPFTICLF
ncbi:eukaryotic translation initiation factor 3c [Medicago truncatula]|uniref:Eukaryotic translation initiation factor 3c n=1 Tax=Medicago truncatula TaxID=3880 RepID=G7KK72_MEDTR|nr:eukaryotic translation initiation factor 3c [Medicago truncatula]